MKKTELWIPAHGFVKDSRAQWMSHVISCHKSVLLFEKLGSSKERTEKLQTCTREQKCQKYQTWLLVLHAQSNSLYTNYCYIRGLDSRAPFLMQIQTHVFNF